MWEVNKTSYNPSLCTLLHLILPRAFKKSELTSKKWQERSLKRQKYRTCSGKTRENFQSFPTSYPSRAMKLWSQELLGFQKCRYIPWERNCLQRRYSINLSSLCSACPWKDYRDGERHFLLSSWTCNDNIMNKNSNWFLSINGIRGNTNYENRKLTDK